MRKRLTLIAAFFCSFSAVFAESVTESQAAATAQQFFAEHGMSFTSHKAKARARAAAGATTTTSAWYAFNADGQGFVIVSGDDRTEAVLGYSLSGSFDYDSAPDNLKSWLQGYADEIAYLQQNNITVTARKSSATDRPAIAPMLQTAWGQKEPYYNSCQKFPRTGDPQTDKYCVTGCVATAMAQVLYYNYQKHPSTIVQSTKAEIPSYISKGLSKQGTTDTVPITIPAIAEGTTIDWANMLPAYGGQISSTEEQQKAVADLMAMCGASVQMDYTDYLSLATSYRVPYALKTYFGFDASTTLVSRLSYTATEWNDMVYNELAADRVVFYDGVAKQGGHAFVIDGYSSNNYFHVNWGWNGSPEGYFLLSVLNPFSYGLSYGVTGTDFNNYADMVINAEPDHGGKAGSPFMLEFYEFDQENETFSFTVRNLENKSIYTELGFYFEAPDDLGEKFEPFEHEPVTIAAFGSATHTTTELKYYNPSFEGESRDYHFWPAFFSWGDENIGPMADYWGWYKMWSASRYMKITWTKDETQEYGWKRDWVLMPGYHILCEKLETNNLCYTGYPCTLFLTVTNNGTDYYEKPVYLDLTSEDGESTTLYAELAIEADETKTVEFNWIPTKAGTYTLDIYNIINEYTGDVYYLLRNGTLTISEGIPADQAISITSFRLYDADLSKQYLGTDNRVVTELDGDSIVGYYNIIFNQDAEKGQRLLKRLYKYDEESKVYKLYHQILTGKTETDISAGENIFITFNWTNLPAGDYIQQVLFGIYDEANQTMDSPLWSEQQYRFLVTGDPTGISEAVADNSDSSAPVVIYTTSGQRVATVSAAQLKQKLATLPRGIYIADGQKIAVK